MSCDTWYLDPAVSSHWFTLLRQTQFSQRGKESVFSREKFFTQINTTRHRWTWQRETKINCCFTRNLKERANHILNSKVISQKSTLCVQPALKTCDGDFDLALPPCRKNYSKKPGRKDKGRKVLDEATYTPKKSLPPCDKVSQRTQIIPPLSKYTLKLCVSSCKWREGGGERRIYVSVASDRNVFEWASSIHVIYVFSFTPHWIRLKS